MAYANLSGSKSLNEAIQRAQAAGMSVESAQQWWSQYGQPDLSRQDYTKSLVTGFETREKAALSANTAREQEIRNIYTSILGQDYGAARTAGLSEISRQEKQDVGQGTQQLISSGMFGTTTAAALPMQAGRVATEQRLKLEDVLAQRKTEAQQQMAGFIERIEQPYPDYSALLTAISAANS